MYNLKLHIIENKGNTYQDKFFLIKKDRTLIQE